MQCPVINRQQQSAPASAGNIYTQTFRSRNYILRSENCIQTDSSVTYLDFFLSDVKSEKATKTEQWYFSLCLTWIKCEYVKNG